MLYREGLVKLGIFVFERGLNRAFNGICYSRDYIPKNDFITYQRIQQVYSGI